MKTKVEQIIRSLSIPMNQDGYDFVTSQLEINEHLSPAEFKDIWKGLDWLSQDGYEGR